MKYIYLFNDSSRASVYGIGNYIRQFIGCLKNEEDIVLNIVQVGSDKKEFEMIQAEDCIKYYFPEIIMMAYQKNHDRYYRNIWYLLHCHIEISESDSLIFHLNYLHKNPLKELAKKTFPTCKVLFTIHYQEWCFAFKGNTSRLKCLIHTNKEHITNEHEKKVLESYEKELQLFHEADHLVCLSKYTQNLLYDEYQIPRNKISLVYNGLKDEYTPRTKEEKKTIKKQLLIPERGNIILFTGRLDDEKGLSYLIKAFQNVLQSIPKCRLIVAGNGKYDIYMKESQDICSKIIYTGFIEKVKLYQLYSIADVGVLPSLHEQCSYVAIEMMMHGLPIIASTTTGLNEMIENGINGLHIPVEEYPAKVEIDSSLLAEKILYLLQNPRERKRLGMNARNKYLDNYELSIWRNKMLNLYDGFNDKENHVVHIAKGNVHSCSSVHFRQRIIRHLMLQASFTSNVGLYHGKMGIVLLFAHYGRFMENTLYGDFAGELLDEIYEDIHSDTPIDFENGLCGIGWAIEYLLQNGFMEGDSDEVLFEIDRKIMERDILRINDTSFRTGLGGVSCYIQKRINSPNRTCHLKPFDEMYIKNWKYAVPFPKIVDDNCILSSIIKTVPAGDNIHSWELGLENGCAGYVLKDITSKGHF